jgi:hypothetical protein
MTGSLALSIGSASSRKTGQAEQQFGHDFVTKITK